jgi:hypothetical protein
MLFVQMKLIAPKATLSQVVESSDVKSHDVEGISKEMIDFVVAIKANSSYAKETGSWPNFTPFT